MRELLRRNRQKNAAIYIQVTRGVAKRDFKFPVPDTPQTLMIMTPNFDFDENLGVLKGWRAKTVKDTRWKRRDIKTVLLLSQSMAKQEAYESGFDDAWMVDDEGFVTEASAANAYIVKNNTIITRPVTNEILKGTTRNAIETLCSKINFKFEERKFTPQEAYEAEEAFCTGATTQITAVIEIDGHKIGDCKRGKAATYLYDEYRAYVEGLRGKQVSWESGL
jgi:D-alanine transaminase